MNPISPNDVIQTILVNEVRIARAHATEIVALQQANQMLRQQLENVQKQADELRKELDELKTSDAPQTHNRFAENGSSPASWKHTVSE